MTGTNFLQLPAPSKSSDSGMHWLQRTIHEMTHSRLFCLAAAMSATVAEVLRTSSTCILHLQAPDDQVTLLRRHQELVTLYARQAARPEDRKGAVHVTTTRRRTPTPPGPPQEQRRLLAEYVTDGLCDCIDCAIRTGTQIVLPELVVATPSFTYDGRATPMHGDLANLFGTWPASRRRKVGLQAGTWRDTAGSIKGAALWLDRNTPTASADRSETKVLLVVRGGNITDNEREHLRDVIELPLLQLFQHGWTIHLGLAHGHVSLDLPFAIESVTPSVAASNLIREYVRYADYTQTGLNAIRPVGLPASTQCSTGCREATVQRDWREAS